MALQIGIVGLPNVGKSTLFNALTKSHAADAANYPFCTIDPNVGVVEVPDERLAKLAAISGSQKIIPTAIEFVDIAGLVAGASKGEGLGNKFLANIRECDAIAHVVRDFENTDIQHVAATPDPKRDLETIETELILADLATAERKHSEFQKSAKSGDKKMARSAELVGQIYEALANGKPARSVEIPEDIDDRKTIRELHLLTIKPTIFVVNLAETDVATFDAATFREKAGLPADANVVPVSAKIESELIELSDEEAAVFLEDLDLKESSLNAVIREAYAALGLITFLTTGPMETRAWTTPRGSTAPQAAGKIHTDFEKKFIRAEVIACDKLVEAGSETAAKEKGWIRAVGKEHEILDGDVCHFLTGA